MLLKRRELKIMFFQSVCKISVFVLVPLLLVGCTKSGPARKDVWGTVT